MATSRMPKSEAMAAIALAQRYYPDINPIGLYKPAWDREPDQHDFETETGMDQVQTSIEYLSMNGPPAAGTSCYTKAQRS